MSTETTITVSGTGVERVSMPLLGLGTWPLTGRECTDAVRQAFELGYRHVDTAENYGNEDAVGRAVIEAVQAGAVAREEVFITSKFNKQHHGDTAAVRGVLDTALSASGLDYLDLYLIHWPNPDQGKYVQTAESLAHLADTGLIRSWGVSNFTPELLRHLTDAGLTAPVNQVQVDPFAQGREYLEANAAAGTATVAYGPVARGEDLSAYPALTEPAGRLDRTEQQVVLRWHVQSGRGAIPKSANAQRQRENLDVFSFELTDEEMAGIDALDTGRGPRQHADTFGH